MHQALNGMLQHRHTFFQTFSAIAITIYIALFMVFCIGVDIGIDIGIRTLLPPPP